MTTYQVMPALADDEYEALCASILDNGILEPIKVDEHGTIIDGHHRKQIADELGIECPTVTLSGHSEAEKRTLALTLNIDRRHLTREQKRAVIENSLRADPQLSDREHGRRTGADHKTVANVRDDLESTGEIPQSEERVSADGRLRPASQPTSKPRPVADLPPAANLSQHDLDELNTPVDPAPSDPPPVERTDDTTEPVVPDVFECDGCAGEFTELNPWQNGFLCGTCFDRDADELAESMTDPEPTVADALAEFPDLTHYANQGRDSDVLRLAAALRGYDEPERSMRITNLRKTIAAEHVEVAEQSESPSRKVLAAAIFDAANLAARTIHRNGGVETVADAYPHADAITADNWRGQYADLATLFAALADACTPKLRSVK